MLCLVASKFLDNFIFRKKRSSGSIDGMQDNDVHLPYSVPLHPHLITANHRKFTLHSENPKHRNRGIRKMANKVSNFSDLIQRVTASCLLHPLVAAGHDDEVSVSRDGDDSDEDNYKANVEAEKENTHYEDAGEEAADLKLLGGGREESRTERIIEMEMILGEVFEAVSAMKRAYVSLQDAHCPWDPDKMRVADVAVVAELRRIGVLKERYRRSVGSDDGGRGRRRVGAATLREVVAPYEAVVDDFKREVKAKEAEIQNLKEKLKTATSLAHCSTGSGKKGKSKRKVSCSTQGVTAVVVPPAPDLFESTMGMVKEASKSFTALLLSLMRRDQPRKVRTGVVREPQDVPRVRPRDILHGRQPLLPPPPGPVPARVSRSTAT
nr:IRK-interacting protein [Ipomoea batatas]